LKANLLSEFGIGKEDLDLVVGGPPCQGFSGIGHRRSYSVSKSQLPSNYLYRDMATLIGSLKPKIFLFENVRGLLNSRWSSAGEKGEIWKDVLATFRSIKNYRTSFQLVFAKDYGVPQNRPRVLLVGVRKDFAGAVAHQGPEDRAVENGFLPRGSGDPPGLVDLLGDLVDPDYENGGITLRYPSPAMSSTQRLLRMGKDGTHVMRKGDPLSEHEYARHSPRVRAKFVAMLDGNGQIPDRFRTKKFAQRVLPRRWDASGPSITATSLSDDYVHFEQPRVLTVREWARLQMFPDWYQFAGNKTTGGVRRAGNPLEGNFDREVPKYTQIGNAVPVALARAVGSHFKSLLER
jgi:DNA (cytosine-5)-methyltransferase 1